MARYVLNTGTVALAAATTKSLILLNPNITVRVTEVGISFDSATSNPSCKVDLYRTTTNGSPAGTTGAPVEVDDPFGNTDTNSSLVNLTTEPTAIEILRSWYVTPTGGVLVVPFSFGFEPQASGFQSFRVGLRVTTPASTTPNCVAYLEYQT